MTIDFESGFETGNTSEWDTELTHNGNINVGSGFNHWGTYGAEVNIDGIEPLGLEWAFVRKYCNYSEFYARMFIYNDWSNGWDNGERAAFFWVVNDAGLNVIFEVAIIKLEGVYRWALRYDHNGVPVQIATFPTSPETDTWYCVEVRYIQETAPGANDGVILVWVNGEAVYAIQDAGNIELGNARAADFGLTTSGGQFAVTFIEDDFAIGDARIGCSEPTGDEPVPCADVSLDAGGCSVGECTIEVASIGEGNYENFHTLSAAGMTHGQTFTPEISVELCSAQFYLQRIGNPDGYVQAQLWAVTGAIPYQTPDSLVPLASSNVVRAMCIPTNNFGMIEFVFPAPTNLVAGTTYAISVYAYLGGTFNDENAVRVGYNINTEFSSGNSFYKSGYSWTSAGEALVPNDDVIFFVCGKQTGEGGCSASEMQSSTLGTEDLQCTHLVPPMAGV